MAEYVEAGRAEGLRVGFYYSLMDWHHPDGARCATDEAARRRFVDYTHGRVARADDQLRQDRHPLVRRLLAAATPKGWESEKMNADGARAAAGHHHQQPQRPAGDFGTPEQQIKAESAGRAWEACMTMNGSWGYHHADDDWKTPKTIVRNLVTCANGGGNYLLNIGPKPDGSIPQQSMTHLTAVGKWIRPNGDSIFGTERCQPNRSLFASFSRKGNTLYMHVHFWPGETVALGGLQNKVLSAKLLATRKAGSSSRTTSE